MTEAVNRRRYDTSGRQAQAARTRLRILEAAQRLFAEQGYAQTSIAQIAAAAGVSGPTVFAGFRSKVGLFKAALEAAIVGDDEPVPLADRPLMRQVRAAGTFDEAAGRLADAFTDVAGRAGAMAVVAQAAADADPAIAELVDTLDGQRLRSAEALAGWFAELLGVDDPVATGRMRDTIWLLNAPQQWDLLVRRRGWTAGDYRDWLAASLRLLARHSTTDGRSRGVPSRPAG